jgi:hypothetical protein
MENKEKWIWHYNKKNKKEKWFNFVIILISMLVFVVGDEWGPNMNLL